MTTSSAELESGYVELFLRIYLLARKIKSLVKDKNTDRLNDLVVLTILRQQPTSVSELAELLSIKPSAMSEKIGQLENDGLISIAKSRDGREKVMAITKQGKDHWKQVMEEIKTHCKKEDASPLTAEEINTAITILHKINL